MHLIVDVAWTEQHMDILVTSTYIVTPTIRKLYQILKKMTSNAEWLYLFF